MPTEILMPALSPTMKEGNLTNWLKKEGDKITPGDVIAEIETDKATMEVEAVDGGILGKILIPAGTENVAVNSVIGLLLEEGEDSSKLKDYKSKDVSTKNKVKTSTPSESYPIDVKPKAEKTETKQESSASAPTTSGKRIKASPLAKRVASEKDISLSKVSGTGPHGRIVKADVLKLIQDSGISTFGATRQVSRNPQEYKEIKNSGMRKTIASRLQQSKQNIPHFYLNIDTRIDKLLDARKVINDSAPKDENDKPKFKITINDLITKAVALALRENPNANVSWSDDAVKIFNNVDISVAVAIEGGLITPIVRNADQKSIFDISNEVKSLAKKAKEGTLKPEEYQGGGFTISNLGMYDIDSFSAIINPPQACILAVGAGKEKAVVENGSIKVGNVMNVILSCDHRAVDGAVAALFLNSFKKYIENPVLLLIS